MQRALSVLALTAVIAAAPLPLRAQEIPDDFLISLERVGISCGGPCPSYTVTISARGDVVYQGKRFVRVQGIATDRIPVSSVRALLATVQQIRFFDLRDSYLSIRKAEGVEVYVTHQPRAVVSVTRNGQTKRIEEMIAAPEGLRALEQQIDNLARTQRWIRIDVATLRQLVETDRPPSAAERQKWLRSALYADEVDVIRALLEIGADPHTLPEDEEAGHDAAWPIMLVRSAAAARAVVDAGADVSASTEYKITPLGAATLQAPGVAEVLLKAGARVDPIDHVGHTPLMTAAGNGNVGVVKLLLAAGADPGHVAEHGTALDLARSAKESDASRQRVVTGNESTAFVKDFDGVIADLEQAMGLR